MLPVVDEFTRECLTIEVERGLRAEDVVSPLEYLFEVRGEPEFIRSDNGPEFIAEAVRSWLARRGSKTLYIAPGSPWENAYSETFNSRLIRFPGIFCIGVPLASRAGQYEVSPTSPRSPAMHIEDHLPLAELQLLAKTILEKRAWVRYQAVILAAQGHSAAGVAKALGCS